LTRVVSQAVPVEVIDRFIGEQMEIGHTPGFGISVVWRGESILERGYGYADLERKVPMTERSQVAIGSTTKAMTAAAVLQLQEQGVLELDDPVQKHLPSFRLADAGAASRITIRQALTHTAGLPPTPIDGPSFVGEQDESREALQRYVDELAFVDLVWDPGTAWLYANDGYTLAGLIVERLAGMPYEEVMQSRLFAPLGLTSAHFPDGSPTSPDLATPYDYDGMGRPFPSFFPRGRATNPAGKVIMHAHDASRWLQTLLSGGELDGQRVLSRDSVAEMFRPQAALPPDHAPLSEYGLGWDIGEIDGVAVFRHGGSVISMGSDFLLAPSEGLAVAVLANSSTAASALIAEGIFSILRGREPRRSLQRVDPSFEPDRSLWPRLAGLYLSTAPSNGVSSPLSIELDGRSLVARTYPAGPDHPAGDVHFLPVGNLEFVLSGRGKTGGTARFEIDGATVRCTFQGVTLERVAARVHRGTVTLWKGGSDGL
jgi:CubicO group peptidase (beta-lactamase class C family)